MPVSPRRHARSIRRRRRLHAATVTAVAMMMLSLAAASPAASQSAATDPLAPVDAQAWVDQEDLTWDAYTPVPGQDPDWRTGAEQGSRDQYTGAVVLLDFTDQPFLITQEPETHPFKNPQPGWEPIPRNQVADWMDAYLNTPNEHNGFQSITGYWMEDTYGKSSVELTTYGPYQLPGKVHEYGLADFAPVRGSNSQCPLGDVCDKNIRADGLALWTADVGNPKIPTEFDNIFFVTAGHDESSTWQEFGEMIFQAREDVPASFGPPPPPGGGPPINNNGEPMENYSPTRYVPWTSWRAAASHWPNALQGMTTQAESSGQSVYAHEFSHVRGLPDNYNNPFADNIRNYTGYWEMMSRGTFNGPGGTHNRWQVPNAGGSGLGPHHMVEFKQQLDLYGPGDLAEVSRPVLSEQGIAVVTLQARSSVPDGDPVGLEVALDGAYTPGECQEDYPPAERSFWCPSGTNWSDFSLEVVDRVGNDSFTPGHGVLLAQSRGSGTPRVWLIDANPEDIGMIDFYRPDGTPVPVVRGDPRQLNDATFHAGTGSGSEFEYVDKFNKLHFYILEKHRDAQGVLHYTVGVRNLDGAGPYARGLSLGQATTTAASATTTRLNVPLTNTGEAGEGRFASDIYRISATVEGRGWTVQLPYEVRAARAGETIPVQALATSGEGAAPTATVTITATSEADPTATQTVTVEVSPQTDGPRESALTLDIQGQGQNRTLVARLASAADPTVGIGGRLIRFSAADGTFLGQSRTNGDGIASLRLPKSYRAPKHRFIAEFGGDAQWLAASATAGG